MNDPQTPPPAESPATPITFSAAHPDQGTFHKAQLETVKNSEALARSAVKPENLAKLTTEGLRTTTPKDLLDDCALWRHLSGETVDAREEGKEKTGEGGDAETLIKREVEYYRGKCRHAIVQNPDWTDSRQTALRARYFINVDIFSDFDQAGPTIQLLLDHAAEDALPGVTPERLATSKTLLDDYTGSPVPQGDAKTLAGLRKTQRDTVFKKIENLRHEIQFTADAVYPWWKDENIPYRREFRLPVGRPFTA